MGVLYEDKHVVCDDVALTLKHYHFPVGSKRVRYVDIKHLEQVEIGWFTGKLRIWGMGPAPYWFHLDWERPQKKKAIIIDIGEWLKIVLTPEHTKQVFELLSAQTTESKAPHKTG